MDALTRELLMESGKEKRLDNQDTENMIFDFLLGDSPEYKAILDNLGIDTNPSHWTKFTTCYGNFIHFQHVESEVIL